MKFLPVLTAVSASAGAVSQAEDGSTPRDSILGAWNTVHTLPFPPGSFREFLTFAEGGVLHETNSFLHTASNLDFSAFGLPSLVNSSDGLGSWKVARTGAVDAVFRKLMFDAAKANFADLLVTGT